MRWFAQQHEVLQALFAAIVAWAMAALGAGLVFPVKRIDRRVLDSMAGFAAGVMIAVSFWSLLLPAVRVAQAAERPSVWSTLFGFLAGGGVLLLVDKTLPHLHFGLSRERAEGPQTPWKRSVLLVLATALHNIPEGLAVGIAFGAAAASAPAATLTGAIALTAGIALQNVPEGAAVTVPLRRDGMRPARAFWYGQLSGTVELAAAVFGAFVVALIPSIAAAALAFAAGAMLFVVIEQLIPQAQPETHTDLTTVFTLLGLAAMMLIAFAFG